MLIRLLLFISLFISFFAKSQTLYWVGGSGYWNDINHWSYISGGVPAGVNPSANSTVIFDNASASSSFTIHALHHIQVNSIISENNRFKIDVIGSHTVDLKLKGSVDLNEFFYLKLNGKIFLEPQSAAQYNFSHNRFTNDVYLISNSDIELGVFSTTKSISISGNLKLKNSIITTNDLEIFNSNLDLINNTIQVKNQIHLNKIGRAHV